MCQPHLFTSGCIYVTQLKTPQQHSLVNEKSMLQKLWSGGGYVTGKSTHRMIRLVATILTGSQRKHTSAGVHHREPSNVSAVVSLGQDLFSLCSDS